MKKHIIWVTLPSLVTLTTLLVCAAQAPDGSLPSDLPSLHTLKNMTYKSAWTRSGKARLADGVYSEQAGPDSATRTRITLSDKVAHGTLNGRQAAVVILVTDPGGSGTFYDLAAVVLRKEKAVNVAVTNLGDRVTINSLSIRDNVVVVDLVVQRPGGEPMPSPTRRVLQAYALKSGKLVLTGTRDAHVTSPGIVGGTWDWEQFQGGDGRSIVVAKPEQYTVQFLADGKVSVRADCNRGSGSYEIDGHGLSISVMAMTMAACPPESLSDQYVRNLNDAASYALHDGRLQLNLSENSGTMTFVREKQGN
jgi:heat shock protein HslJ